MRLILMALRSFGTHPTNSLTNSLMRLILMARRSFWGDI
jgi:hypothetical protein